MKFKHGSRRRASEYEKDWMERWKKDGTFEKSVENRSADDSYVFYDGPPFITGVPHHGTLLSSIVKDAVPRYWTMKGKRVERVWGWDCHGLPAENFVEKQLGIVDRRQIVTKKLSSSDKFLGEFYDEGFDLSKADSYKTRESVRGIVIDDSGRIALVHSRKRDFYNLPGGGVEVGETQEVAAVREVGEELGIEFSIQDEVGTTTEYDQSRQRKNNAKCFYGKIVGEPSEANLAKDEAADEFELIWANDISDAIKILSKDGNDFHLSVQRDVAFLKEMQRVLDDTLETTPLGKDGKELPTISLETYINKARESMVANSATWEGVIDRIGRWVDFKGAYKTMDKDFMESVWWAFKKLYDAGKIYEGEKVLMYDTKFATPVSKAEVTMDNDAYQTVTDPSVYVKLRLKSGKKTSLTLNKDAKVLFVCMANVGRSQFAKGFYDSLSGSLPAESAGVHPDKGWSEHGKLSDRVDDLRTKFDDFVSPIDIMNEVDIDISDHSRMRLTQEKIKDYDLIVNLAERSQTPDWLRGKNVIWWDVPDPTPEGEGKVLREVRDLVAKRVKELISGKIIDDDIDATHFLAWTTTPWTLPANLMLAVNPEMTYCEVLVGGEKLIIAEEALERVLKDDKNKPLEYKVLRKFPGSELVGKSYEPLDTGSTWPAEAEDALGVSIRALSVDDGEKEFEYLKQVPQNENGFHNPASPDDLKNLASFKKFLQTKVNHSFGKDLKPGYVPNTVYWVEKDGEIVGVGNVRHYLNDKLRDTGSGHIGLGGIKYRGRGIGTAANKLLIKKVFELGEDIVAVGAMESNAASRRMIEKSGGVLDRIIDDQANPGGKLYAYTISKDAVTADQNNGKIHKVYAADFVSHESGTGIVHIAPAYGEDDFELAKSHGVKPFHVIDDNGYYTDTIYKGLEVWDNNKFIAKDLKEKGIVWRIEYIQHEYPFNPRSKQRIMYRAIPSWFFDIQGSKSLMLEQNENINWFPEHLKYGRFAKNIEQAPDWNLSRDRFWATAMPVWKGDKGTVKVVGSYEELKELSGVELEDYHRPWVDDIEFDLPYVSNQDNETDTEKLDVLDENGNLTGKTKDRKLVHRDGDWHKAVHIWIVNDNNEILLQRRVAWKDSNPNMLDISSAGHVVAGDSSLSAAVRELQEELGLKVNPEDLQFVKRIKKQSKYTPTFIDNEFDDMFILKTDKTVSEMKTQKEEVAEVFFVSFEKFREMVEGKDPELLQHTEQFEILFDYFDGKEIPHEELNNERSGETEHFTRIDKVLDCWFESGSMPFAQLHYPFENQEKFEKNYPAEFITEYIPQVRAWFYYVHTINTSLADIGAFGEDSKKAKKNAFENVITTGTLAGNDGRKMSKSLGNFTDPNELMDKFSADSLRFLLLSSPLLNAEDFSLQDKEVGDVARKLSMIWNMYDFFTMYAEVDNWETSDPAQIKYFVHGTTTDNEEERSTGWNDGELSDLGIQHSKDLAETLANEKFDAIFCSDLKRAIDSAELNFPGQKIIQDKRLRECNYGDLNGAASDRVIDEDHIDTPFPNGESLRDVELRIREFAEFLNQNYSGKKVAIVAHKAPQLAFQVICEKLSWSDVLENDWRKQKKWQPGWNYRYSPMEISLDDLTNPLDIWIVSRLHQLNQQVTENMDKYNIPDALSPILPFIDDASNWFVRRSRRRFWKSEDDSDKNDAYKTLHYVLLKLSVILAPFTPFLAEELYHNMGGEGESVHLLDWPTNYTVDQQTLDDMARTRELINTGLGLRMQKDEHQDSIKVRQPLATVSYGGDKLGDYYEQIISDELNVKSIKNISSEPADSWVEIDKKITPELKREGLMREVIRLVQSARKQAGLNVDDRIVLSLTTTDQELRRAIDEWQDAIRAETLSEYALDFKTSSQTTAKIDNTEIEIKLKKVS